MWEKKGLSTRYFATFISHYIIANGADQRQLQNTEHSEFTVRCACCAFYRERIYDASQLQLQRGRAGLTTGVSGGSRTSVRLCHHGTRCFLVLHSAFHRSALSQTRRPAPGAVWPHLAMCVCFPPMMPWLSGLLPHGEGEHKSLKASIPKKVNVNEVSTKLLTRGNSSNYWRPRDQLSTHSTERII